MTDSRSHDLAQALADAIIDIYPMPVGYEVDDSTMQVHLHYGATDGTTVKWASVDLNLLACLSPAERHAIAVKLARPFTARR